MNRIVLLTGGTGVIGKAIAARFLKDGDRVILTGSSASSLDALRADASFPSHGWEGEVADMSDLTAIQALMGRIAERHGRLDVLVTAAGIYGEIGTIKQADPLAWTQAFTVNVFGTWWCIKYALPLLTGKERRGRIITFAGGGEGPLPHFSSYAASKGAMLRLTETLGAELAEYGVTINAISPGLVNSGFVKDLLKAGKERVGEKKFAEAQAQVAGTGGSVTPDRAAGLVFFLASDAAGTLTGKNLSAIWDRWEDIPTHADTLLATDIYNWRRIKPTDRGYAW